MQFFARRVTIYKIIWNSERSSSRLGRPNSEMLNWVLLQEVRACSQARCAAKHMDISCCLQFTIREIAVPRYSHLACRRVAIYRPHGIIYKVMSDISQHFKPFLVGITNCGASPQTYTWTLKRSLVGHDTKCVLPVRNQLTSSSMPWLSAYVYSFGESPEWHSCHHYQRTQLIISRAPICQVYVKFQVRVFLCIRYLFER